MPFRYKYSTVLYCVLFAPTVVFAPLFNVFKDRKASKSTSQSSAHWLSALFALRTSQSSSVRSSSLFSLHDPKTKRPNPRNISTRARSRQVRTGWRRSTSAIPVTRKLVVFSIFFYDITRRRLYHTFVHLQTPCFLLQTHAQIVAFTVNTLDDPYYKVCSRKL